VKDPFDLENLKLKPGNVVSVSKVTPRKIAKRRQCFVQVPWALVEALRGVSSQTWYLAMYLAHLRWKNGDVPIKLANGMLEYDHLSRATKWRALAELERRELISVERRPRKSPIITLGPLFQK
jgi:hypothetical protein